MQAFQARGETLRANAIVASDGSGDYRTAQEAINAVPQNTSATNRWIVFIKAGTDRELDHWRTLATACQDAGADGLELNLSCPHMDREDMGSNIGKDQGLCSFVTQVVKEVARVPVWAKLTPATSDIVLEAVEGFVEAVEADARARPGHDTAPVGRRATVVIHQHRAALHDRHGIGGMLHFRQGGSGSAILPD